MILVWRISEICNYACGFCAYDRRLSGPRREVEAEEALRFGRLLGGFGRERGEPVLLSWLGGEPLLWRPILPVSRLLASEGGIAISATTNGSTLHRAAVRDAILAGFAELTVSVDGFAPLHDRLRGAPGAWDRVREGVIRLAAERKERRAAFKLRANVVLMRSTLPDFAALCGALADWGIDEITFNQLGGRDRPEFFPAERLRAEDSAALTSMVPDLRARLASRGVRLCADPLYLGRIRASAAGEMLAVGDCGLGRQFLFVDEKGLISPCSFSSGAYGVPIASLRTVGDLAALPSRFGAAHAAGRCAACDDCPSTQMFAKFAA